MSDATGEAPDQETAVARIERLRTAVLEAPPESLRAALARMPDSTLADIAKAAATPMPVLRRSADPGARLRRTTDPRHLALVAEAMVQSCLEVTVDTLGEASDDPTFEQLVEALETTATAHSPGEIAAMLAYVAATGQAAAAVCDRVLTEDDRFKLTARPSGAEGAADRSGRAATRPPTGATPEQREERRRRRQAEKEERRRREEVAARAANAARDRARKARHHEPSDQEADTTR